MRLPSRAAVAAMFMSIAALPAMPGARASDDVLIADAPGHPAPIVIPPADLPAILGTPAATTASARSLARLAAIGQAHRPRSAMPPASVQARAERPARRLPG